MLKLLAKAIWGLIMAIIILLGAVMFLGVVSIAWPVLIALLVIGIPFIVIGIIVGRNK